MAVWPGVSGVECASCESVYLSAKSDGVAISTMAKMPNRKETLRQGPTLKFFLTVSDHDFTFYLLSFGCRSTEALDPRSGLFQPSIKGWVGDPPLWQ